MFSSGLAEIKKNKDVANSFFGRCLNSYFPFFITTLFFFPKRFNGCSLFSLNVSSHISLHVFAVFASLCTYSHSYVSLVYSFVLVFLSFSTAFSCLTPFVSICLSIFLCIHTFKCIFVYLKLTHSLSEPQSHSLYLNTSKTLFLSIYFSQHIFPLSLSSCSEVSSTFLTICWVSQTLSNSEKSSFAITLLPIFYAFILFLLGQHFPIL